MLEMKLLDYIRRGDYSELNEVLGRKMEFCSSDREIARVINEFFAQEPEPMLIEQQDFERVFEKFEHCVIGELVTQLGVDDMVEMIKSRQFRTTIPSNPSMVSLCIEFSDEKDATCDNAMKVLQAVSEIGATGGVCWGTRINPSLPGNGCKILILTDIPDDYIGPALYECHL